MPNKVTGALIETSANAAAVSLSAQSGALAGHGDREYPDTDDAKSPESPLLAEIARLRAEQAVEREAFSKTAKDYSWLSGQVEAAFSQAGSATVRAERAIRDRDSAQAALRVAVEAHQSIVRKYAAIQKAPPDWTNFTGDDDPRLIFARNAWEGAAMISRAALASAEKVSKP
ncbi:hypothetical protein SAMN05519103_00300 [Rhizobiales bacterium GAS113]|nr:hypothetical protein SAMN05519103_00300 [Rhizobiales bacterium GAS113]